MVSLETCITTLLANQYLLWFRMPYVLHNLREKFHYIFLSLLKVGLHIVKNCLANKIQQIAFKKYQYYPVLMPLGTPHQNDVTLTQSEKTDSENLLHRLNQSLIVSYRRSVELLQQLFSRNLQSIVF